MKYNRYGMHITYLLMLIMVVGWYVFDMYCLATGVKSPLWFVFCATIQAIGVGKCLDLYIEEALWFPSKHIARTTNDTPTIVYEQQVPFHYIPVDIASKQ